MKTPLILNSIMLWTCVACNPTPTTNPTTETQSTAEKVITEKNAITSLDIPKHHIAVQITLDDQPYTQ